MSSKDLVHNIKATRALSPVVIMAGNATYTSEIIDTQGFESLTFLVIAGALTDATYTCDLYDDTASNMGTEVVVAAADMMGQAPAFTFDYSTEDNTVKKVAYKGSKRYVRLKIVQAAATTGGYINAVAILGGARNAPVT